MLRIATAFIAVLVSLGLIVPAHAAIINASTVIDDNNSFPGETVEVVDGANPPTVVTVNGGVIGGWRTNPDIVARGMSVVRLNSGGIQESDQDAIARLYDQSRLQVFGEYGYAPELSVILHDSARLDLVAGGSIGGASLSGTSHLRSENGKIEHLTTYDNTTARIINTVGSLDRLHITARGNSVVKNTRGRVEWIRSQDESTIWHDGSGLRPSATGRSNFHWVYGARFTDVFDVRDEATLHLYGYDMEYTIDNGGEVPAVQGYRKDGTRFYTPVVLYDNARIVFHTVPEPGSVVLAGLGALACVIFRRRLAGRL